MANLEYEIARMTKALKTVEEELYNSGKELAKLFKIASKLSILKKH